MTTSADVFAAVDTNVLVYAVYPSAPQHAASRRLLETRWHPEAKLCLFPQILAEFYAVVTNPRRVSPVKTASEAIDTVDQFLALPGLRLLPLPADVVSRWLSLLRTAPVTGGDVFDRQLAAAMTAHGVATLYTYNVRDFAGIPGIVAEEPPADAATLFGDRP